jgi:single-stranded-DNA-specific exonuclease
MQKVWKVKKYDDEYIHMIMKKFNISKILAKLVVARGIKLEDIEGFLYGTLEYIKDPYLIKDMEKFVERVKIAKKEKEKICIYGDYDVDGITSTVIMYKFLTNLGLEVSYYLPDRLTEGYGVNKGAIDNIKKTGATLVITVDCGIKSIEEVLYAKSIGVDFCITDHHECGEIIPEAYCIINPKQKDDNSYFKMHAGVGVAFKCIMALAKEYNLKNESYLKYLDIVAIGTISDIVPMVDENRIISKYGLKQIKETKNIGLRELLNVIKFKDVDSIMISYLMAPRINACGRMGDANIAVKLLLSKDVNEAKMLANKLDELNTNRQVVEKHIFEHAIKMIEENNLNDKHSIVLYDSSWHNGVIGIVASRLVGIYFKPVILITKENNKISGSGRCPSGFSLYDSVEKCSKYVSQFGGHELAVGFSIEEENIENFRECFEKIASNYSNILNEELIDVDMEIIREDLNSQLLRDIRFLKPYGQSNKTPMFLYKNLKVKALRTLKEDKHLKLTLQDGKFLIDAIAFAQGSRKDEILVGDMIDVITQVELNTYNGNRIIQFIVQDFKKIN